MKVGSFYAQLANITNPSLLTLSDGKLQIKVDRHDGAAARLLLWLTEHLPETATVADLLEVLDAAKWWATFFSSVPLDPPCQPDHQEDSQLAELHTTLPTEEERDG